MSGNKAAASMRVQRNDDFSFRKCAEEQALDNEQVLSAHATANLTPRVAPLSAAGKYTASPCHHPFFFAFVFLPAGFPEPFALVFGFDFFRTPPSAATTPASRFPFPPLPDPVYAQSDARCLVTLQTRRAPSHRSATHLASPCPPPPDFFRGLGG